MSDLFTLFVIFWVQPLWSHRVQGCGTCVHVIHKIDKLVEIHFTKYDKAA